jgi:iron complex outermembrane receptor protein
VFGKELQPRQWEADMKKHVLTATTAFVTLISVTPAYSQEAAEEEKSGIQDIVVTAQRRNESVQDVPIAISAFSSEQLEAQGVNNTLQLGQYIPNLFALNNTGLGSANGYYLRGLGNTESIATFDPPVGTYVDDIYLSRQNANNLSLLDVERIEVLRGPQGTLFGRNTTGGAINVIMRDPGAEVGGFVEAGYGRYDRKLLRGSIDLPIGDVLGIKVSAFSQNDDGYTKNVTTGQRINDDDGWGARLGLRLNLGGDSTWRASVASLHSNAENVLNFLCNPANTADCKGRFVTTGLVEAKTTTAGPFRALGVSGRKGDFGLGNRTANTIATSNFEFGLSDDIKVNVITGVVRLRQEFALDFFDGRGGPSIATPVPPVRGFARGGFSIVNDGSHNQFTQEVKLGGKAGPIDFVGGFFYFKEKNKTDFADVFSIFTGAPGGLGLLLADRTLRNTTTAYAGYFQGDFNLSEQLKITAGIRYTDETKNFDIRDNRASCRDGTVEATCVESVNLVVNPPVVPTAIRIPAKQSAKLWTPRFAINYKPNDDMLVFVSATRGFKSGGWNARGTAASELLPFGPEKVWSYEAGIKSDLMDNRVRANLTVYYQDTKDLQTPSAFVRANGTLAFITRNFADYTNKGAELELTFQPVDNLNLYFNAGYQDDKYKIDRSAPALDPFGVRSVSAQQALCQAALAAGNISGGPNTTNCGAGIVAPNGSIATPVRTPKISLAMGASYKAPLGGSGWSVTPSVNASFASKSQTGTSQVTIFSGSVTGTNGTFPANLTSGDFIAGSLSKAHWLINAGLTIKSPEDALSFGIECSNCLSESFVQSTLANYSYYNRPMEWMLRAKYKF